MKKDYLKPIAIVKDLYPNDILTSSTGLNYVESYNGDIIQWENGNWG